MDILVNTDGGNRGNPGPAAWAFVVKITGENTNLTIPRSGFIESATNNGAEYRAMINALQWLSIYADHATEPCSVIVQSDSEVIVKHLLGVYQCKNPSLQPLFLEALAYYEVCKDVFANFRLIHIPRELNTEPDALCRAEMDARGAVHPLKGKKRGKKSAKTAVTQGETAGSNSTATGPPQAEGFGGI